MNKKVRNDSKGYLFVVGGPGCSGSTTISKMLAKHFSLKRVYGGKIFRDMLEDTNHNFEKDIPKKDVSNIDKKVDKLLLEISNQKDILIESKIFGAIATEKNIPCTVKIWLNASIHRRTLRAMYRDKETGMLKYFKTRDYLCRRYDFDRKRFSKLYGIKYDKPELYNDIVLDTSDMDEKETFNLILKNIKDGGYIKKRG